MNVRGILGSVVRPSIQVARRRLSAVPDLDNTLIITNSCAKVCFRCFSHRLRTWHSDHSCFTLEQRIKYLQDKANNPNLQLRVSVDGGGCSGFQYRFEMQPEVKEEDDK